MADLRNRKNILVGAPEVKASGGFVIGKPVTSAEVPTDALAELPAAMDRKTLGFIGEDGVTKTVNRETEKIKDWNGDTAIVLDTEHSVVLKTTFLEAGNPTVLTTVYGNDNVDIDGSTITTKDTADSLPHFSCCFEIKAASDRKIRVFVPDGQVTSIGDVSFVKSDLVKYEVEIECFPDDQGVKLYSLISDLGAVPAGREETTTTMQA